MKKWMKKMAIIGAVLFVGGIGVTSIGAAIGGAAAGLEAAGQRKTMRIVFQKMDIL